MSEGLNKVMLLGNLGADPELKVSQGGNAVLKLRMATTHSYLDRNNTRQESTEWHRVTIFGKRGEALAKFLAKGDRIFIEGRIQTSSYEKDGEKRYSTEVIAENVILNGRGKGSSDDSRDGGNDDRGSSRGGNGGGYSRRNDGGGGNGGGGGGGAGSRTTNDYGGDYGGGADDEIPF